MVDIVLVSHSLKLVEGLKELVAEMASDVNIYAVGGTKEGEIGTDYDQILATFENVGEDGAIVLFDLGSSYMASQMALEALPESVQNKIAIVDAPLVECSIEAAVLAGVGNTIAEIVNHLAKYKLGKIPN